MDAVGASSVNRTELQQLTRDRVRDAEVLLASGQWAGAYHMAGYALECALKSCILKLIDDTGLIFKDKKYLDKLAKCWTHDLDQLIDLAELTAEFGKARGANHRLNDYWETAQEWQEVSRYERKTEAEARELFEAITNVPDGVLPWIQTRW
jgi:HEPN domain-containing protein